MMDSNGCADSVNTEPTLTTTVPVQAHNPNYLNWAFMGFPVVISLCHWA